MVIAVCSNDHLPELLKEQVLSQKTAEEGRKLMQEHGTIFVKINSKWFALLRKDMNAKIEDFKYRIEL